MEDDENYEAKEEDFQFDDDLEEDENLKVDPLIKEFVETSKTVLFGNPIETGSGDLIGLKLALQSLKKHILVTSGKMSKMGNYINNPSVDGGNDAVSVAKGIARSSKDNVLVYADDITTEKSFDSLINAAENNENIIYICYNNQNSKEFNIRKMLYFNMRKEASYVATASVSHPEDYIRKLREAEEIEGFRFIEILSPLPKKWGFDASNTIEIARVAVNSNVWPLIKYLKGKLHVTVSSDRLENITNYFEMQRKFRDISEDTMSEIKNNITEKMDYIQRNRKDIDD